MLVLKDLTVILGQDSCLEKCVLRNLNLRVLPGEFVVLIGGNGAGKSTLFKAITGEVPRESGEILLDGQDIAQLSLRLRSAFIANVSQDPRTATMEHLTLEENLSFAWMRGQARGLKPCKNKERRIFFQERLKLVNQNLEHRLEEQVRNLSGGQRQALSLIMATLRDSKILLLDEITAALDPAMADLVMELTAGIVRRQGRSALLITHNMDYALRYGDRTLVLRDGHIVKEYRPLEKATMRPRDLCV